MNRNNQLVKAATITVSWDNGLSDDDFIKSTLINASFSDLVGKDVHIRRYSRRGIESFYSDVCGVVVEATDRLLVVMRTENQYQNMNYIICFTLGDFIRNDYQISVI